MSSVKRATTHLALTDTIVRFGLETRIEDVPSDVIDIAKLLILDTIGVALVASTKSVGQIITRWAAETSGAPKVSTVIGGGIKVAPSFAALANGTMANALDFDGGFHHPTTVLPTALAIAEQRGLSGKDILEAFVLCMEIAGRLQQSIDGARQQKRGPTQRGWWHVKLIGPLAAAMTAARLLGLSHHQTTMALGISSNGSGGFRRSMGTMAKGFHSGCAARDGIDAANLAVKGFTGDPDILEAPLGFYDAICLVGELDTSAITEQLGNPYIIARSKGNIKYFPACAPAHPLIDAALALRALPSMDLNSIQSIEADLATFELNRHDAVDEEEAGFSGAYVIAATLIHGKFGLDQIRKEALHLPRVRELMSRISHTPLKPNETRTISARLRCGNELRVDIPTHSRRRMTDSEEISAKFLNCASHALTANAAEQLRDRILKIERQKTVRSIMTLARGNVES